MEESEITQLVREIQEAGAQEFWWDNPLLARAVSAHDPRIVRVLAFRHNCLGNKNAFSAHVIRQAICICDGPDLATLWACIDQETNSERINDRMEDPRYLPWASAYIIGEIGGKSALQECLVRLTPQHSSRHYLLVRLFSHLLLRYLSIENDAEPNTVFMDLRTGEQESIMARYADTKAFDMESRKRREANVLFTPLSRKLVQEAESKLETIPDEMLNLDRMQFNSAFEHIRKSIALRGL